MIVGKAILDRNLIKSSDTGRLKNSTFDLTIGDIIPIGKVGIKLRRAPGGLRSYILDPREMVWILSKEEFSLPSNVTGIATLRTTFTQQGMLALNVGIIDPHFDGPISTALINFSDVPREIKAGEAFFRVVFIEHEDVSAYKPQRNESRRRNEYLGQLEQTSLENDFPQNFLNIPKLTDDYYADIFGRMILSWIKKHKWWSFLAAIVIAVIGSFLFKLGLWEFMKVEFEWLKSIKSQATPL